MSTVLITGASRGIGKAAAELFANEGWDLLLLARDEKALHALSKDLSKTGRSIGYKSVDLSNALEVNNGISELLNQGETPSVLINNAGVAWTGDLLSMTLKSWQWVLQMNLTSVFQVC